MIRANLFQTPIAKLHSTTAMDDKQFFFALEKMLRDNASPYKQAWQEEYRKMLTLPFNLQMNKLLTFIRDNKALENQYKSNERRTPSTKVPTLVSTSTSQQEHDNPFNLASSGGNLLSDEYDTYLTYGGDGGCMNTILAVTPTETLSVYVGGTGANVDVDKYQSNYVSGGANGGGKHKYVCLIHGKFIHPRLTTAYIFQIERCFQQKLEKYKINNIYNL
jgi:hypothetical protein